MNKIFTMMGLGLVLACASAYAQDKVEVKPSGRILMDGGLFKSDNKSLVNGLAVPDLRVGVKAAYGDYKAKVDVGFAYGKVSLKDVFVERKLGKNNLIRAGYFVHQFGLQSSTSSSMKISMEEPASNEAFFNSRLIGAMLIHDQGQFFGTLSFHVEGEAIKKASNDLGKQGYGMMSRLIYRPLHEEGRILHVGLSGAFESPRYNEKEALNHKSYTLKSNFPTRIAKVTAQQALITDAKMLYKFTPEICAAYGRVGLETQYYYLNVKRENGLPSFKASGAYALVRGLILGSSYKYSDGDAGIATPDAGSLECVLGYNYTDLSDHKAQILGGRQNDASLTLNYYINKYMIWRLRYSYTHVSDRAGFDNQSVNGFQTRLQIIF
ncbi:OprO/OprP family phosphate-selective porin [Porphyromonas pogonae]|uniref:OprO/OprP family phosphate-selective porin n=1 Tax=Porphyromonas pogonae TaxID=867595 RepID=UPI002E7841E9|nr:porin [Porphyromonas pogonae]